MATRKKFSQLDEISELSIDDILAVSDDPSGSPVSKKAGIQKLVDLLEKGYFARQVDNVSDLSSEEAGSGYICIVRDLDRGGIFKAVNSGSADNGVIFASATSGWTWQRLFSGEVNAKWFACAGDDSTSNNSTLQAAVDYCNTNGRTLYIPKGTYKVTDFINFYDITVVGDGRDRTIVKSYATNKPIAVFAGTQFTVNNIGFHYDSIKTNKSCSCILVSGVSGGVLGAYWSSFRDISLLYGNYLVHTTGTLSTTLSSSASLGASSISVSTVSSGSFDCIVAGGYITVNLDSGTQNVQVDYVSGTTVYLKTSLSGAATSGNAVSCYETIFFSNTLDNIYCRYWNNYAIVHNGSGTGCKFDNIYMARGEASSYSTCIGFMYLSGFNDGSFGQINCEWAEISGQAISLYGGDTLAIDSLHCEGVKFGSSNLCYISTTLPSLTVSAWTIDDWVVPSASTVAALIRVESVTTYSPNVTINGLSIRDSQIDSPSNTFWLNNQNGSNCYVYINGFSGRSDCGLNIRGQLVTPSTGSVGLKRVLPYFDEDIVGYGFLSSLTTASDVTCFATDPYISVDQVLIGNSELSLSTAVIELRTATGGGGTEIIGSSALSAITSSSTYFKANNSAGVDNTVLDFSSDGRIYLRVTTNQVVTSVSGTSSSVRRFNDGTNGYGINRITWGSSHGVQKGELITVSGATDTSFNGTFIVLDVTSTTIDYYNHTGSSVSSTADTGVSISRLPIVDVILKGRKWSKPLY